MKYKNLLLACFFMCFCVCTTNTMATTYTDSVSIGGTTYNLQNSGLINYTANPSYFTSSYMPWFGNATLAGQIATAVGMNLGGLSGGTPTGGGFSALTAYAINGSFVSIQYFNGANISNCPVGCPFVGSNYNYIILGSPVVYGPSAINTQQSLVNTSSSLQSSITLQNTNLINGFTYDCAVFDVNGICVSAGGRNTQVSAGFINNTSGLLIGSYRLDENNSRIGMSLDQNFSTSMPGGTIKQSNNTPMVGVFGVWQENLDSTGWQAKVSAGMGQKDTTIQRTVVGTSEPGVGSATMISQGAQATAKYGFAVIDDVIVLPYVGLRYTRNNMGGYTEATSSTVTAPLIMNKVNTNSSAALIGVEGNYRVMPDVMLLASGGLERNMSTNYDAYVATSSSISGLAPISMNPNIVRTRPTASLGAYYDVEKNQRLGVNAIYRQEMYQAVGTTTVMATYTVGL